MLRRVLLPPWLEARPWLVGMRARVRAPVGGRGPALWASRVWGVEGPLSLYQQGTALTASVL